MTPKKTNFIYFIVLTLLFVIFIFCCGFIGLTIWDSNHIDKYGYPGFAAQINKVTLTTALDNNTPLNDLVLFDKNTDRVYCVLSLHGLFYTRMGAFVRIIWYYEDEEITGHAINTETWSTIVVWLEPSSGETFRSGDYRVDIFIDYYFVRSVYFRIKE